MENCNCHHEEFTEIENCNRISSIIRIFFAEKMQLKRLNDLPRCTERVLWTHRVPPRSNQRRINQAKQSINKERPCTTTSRIKKEQSICQSLLCLDLVSCPVLSQIKSQAALLVVSFRQFLQVSALRPNTPRAPRLISNKVLKESQC